MRIEKNSDVKIFPTVNDHMLDERADVFGTEDHEVSGKMSSGDYLISRPDSGSKLNFSTETNGKHHGSLEHLDYIFL